MTWRGLRPPVPLGAALAALSLLLAAAPAARSAAGGPWKRNAAFVARVDTLFVAGRFDACGALLDSAITAAAGAHDRGLERVARIRRARLETMLRRLVEARRDLQLALDDARASADTLSECRGLVALGAVEALEPDLTTESARRAVTLARRAGLREEQAAAWCVIGSAELPAQRFEEAAADYRRALELLARSSDWRAVMVAHNGLGRCLISTGDFAGARREHEIVLQTALRHGDLVQLAETWQNFGVLEHRGGNPAAAESCYIRAAALSRFIGWPARTVSAERNLALLYINIGKNAQSESVLTHVLPVAERAGDRALLALVYSQLGVACRQLGRYGDAETFGRRAVALTDSIPMESALQVTATLVGTLRTRNRVRDALELVEAQRARLDPRMSDRDRATLAYLRADQLVSLGRPREGIAALRAMVKDTPPVAGLDGFLGVETRDRLARCYAALGERDSAIMVYREATVRWEVARRGVTDQTWREGLDNVATNFSRQYAILLLDPARGGAAEARAAEAFDMLQRFRARTLAERVRGPGAGDSTGFEPIGLATLRSAGLRAGEVFFDIHASADTTVVFAVTRERIQAYSVAGSLKLGSRLRVHRRMLADPTNANPSALSEASVALGRDLFGPASETLNASSRIFFAAGTLAQYPLGALVAPGQTTSLDVTHEVATVPSATLLKAWRSRPQAASSPGRVLAIAASRDEEGHALPFAAREVSRLSKDFEGVEAHVDARWTAEQFVARGFRGVTVLHFASHTRMNANQPWHSGLQVGDARVPGSSLEASRIAQLRVPARLVVLSSCSSFGGRNDAGETLYGLAAAWLAAGVPTVIATQWDADDQALAEFTPRFYAHLARGETAGAALRAAAAEVRANPKFAAPYFWQGIVLLGDPETRVPLRPRRPPPRETPGS